MDRVGHRVITWVVAAIASASAARGEEFNFSRQLFGPPSTLSVFVESLDASTGCVVINGGDSQQPSTPFSWDWGDGSQAEGFFPLQHVYGARARNYIVQVTAHYSSAASDRTEVVVRFVAPQLTRVQLPPDVLLSIPASGVSLSSRLPGHSPPPLTFFEDAHFGIVPRSTVEYVLSVAAVIQNDFMNGNVAKVAGGFQQVVLRDSVLPDGAMYSLWYTEPVAFAAATATVSGFIAYSSFFHEMGHSFALNFPAGFHYGGKIDGNANAIFSESMAQVLQHAAAYEMINHGGQYGLPDDLMADIKASATSSMLLVRNSYDAYVQSGADFESWNNPSTPGDETFGTFMTIAYKFFEHAEADGRGYRAPLRRMVQLLQILDEDMIARYDRLHDTPKAEAFRSTLMVTAVSRAFGMDLRPEFAALDFPIDNATYHDLLATARLPGDVNLDGDVDWVDHRLFVQCFLEQEGLMTDPPLSSECAQADLHTDLRIDLLDFALFQNGFLPF